MKGQRKQLRKTIITYLILSLAAIVIDKVYDIFGHGVDSNAMTWMFLYPLLGGAVFYSTISLFFPNIIKFTGYRGFYNLYNSGIATLTFGSFLKGILEIAGTNSNYLVFFYTVGGGFIAVGLIMLSFMLIRIMKEIEL